MSVQEDGILAPISPALRIWTGQLYVSWHPGKRSGVERSLYQNHHWFVQWTLHPNLVLYAILVQKCNEDKENKRSLSEIWGGQEPCMLRKGIYTIDGCPLMGHTNLTSWQLPRAGPRAHSPLRLPGVPNLPTERPMRPQTPGERNNNRLNITASVESGPWTTGLPWRKTQGLSGELPAFLAPPFSALSSRGWRQLRKEKLHLWTGGSVACGHSFTEHLSSHQKE